MISPVLGITLLCLQFEGRRCCPRFVTHAGFCGKPEILTRSTNDGSSVRRTAAKP
jgi:hypothetical protein